MKCVDFYCSKLYNDYSEIILEKHYRKSGENSCASPLL